MPVGAETVIVHVLLCRLIAHYLIAHARGLSELLNSFLDIGVHLCTAHGAYGADYSCVGVSLVYLAEKLHISLCELGTAGLVVLAAVGIVVGAEIYHGNVNRCGAVIPWDIIGSICSCIVIVVAEEPACVPASVRGIG